MIEQPLQFARRAARGIQHRFQTLSIKLALRRLGLNGAFQIPSFTVQEELEALYELARQCRPDARVLEIGSYLGASTCFLAAGLRGPNATIVCVDTWQNQTMSEGIRDTLPEFLRNVEPIRPKLTLIRKFSSDVSPSELGGRFDLVFLDGDHSYRQTRADFELVSNWVVPNGILAFHDSAFFEGVSRVVGEALASAQWRLGGTVRNLCWLHPACFEHKS